MRRRRLTLFCLLTVVALQLGATPSQKDDESKALDFLYKYMPLPDSLDYPIEFWRQNVAYALKARDEMGWNVPEREWLHFVLPPRVNNEELDNCRPVFYEMLKDRIRGLSMYDAILEVNHWCHEKVTYQPSDSRTSAALATMRSGIGRCGEESTFAVAALRAVGIPARQVYTPRWAHTDDNHAWVEAWADGKWYFLGACEPEPVLNLGWFNAPASRGMIMNTYVFGHYDGPEDVIGRDACYTIINVTSNYAPTSSLVVRTIDAQGQLCPAYVEFKLYNYAEFYTIGRRQSSGICSFNTGLGDLLVWASHNGNYGFAKASVGRQDTITIILDNPTGTWETEIVPPAERNTQPKLTDEQIQANRLRLAKEDSIREHTPHGNQSVLNAFLTGAADKEKAELLLSLLTEKDRRDVTIDVLTDSYLYSPSTDPNVFNPRVCVEPLTPYKAYLGSVLPRLSLEEWRQWVLDSIRVDQTRNPQRLCMSPASVWRERVADVRSRDIFFVAGARALGHAASYDPVYGRSVPALTSQRNHQTKGLFRLMPETKTDWESSYYTHFTLSKLENGSPRLLSFPEEGVTAQDFAQGKQLEQGTYLLTTGTRLAKGDVLVRTRIFQLTDSLSVPLALRHDNEQLQVIGNLNAEDIYTDRNGHRQAIISTTGRGYYVLGLVQDKHEPSNHALHDIALKQKELETIGRPILILNAEDNRPIVEEIAQSLHLETRELPLFVIADTFNRIVWVSQGYTIGMGEQLLRALKKL